MCNSPYSPRASARTFSTDSSARFSNSRTSSRKSFPSAVNVTPRGLRFIKSTPISSSRSCTCRLNAGCATRSCAAALVKFNASPTQKISQMPEFHCGIPLCRKGMAAQPTWYFTKVMVARYCRVMTELLEANERSQTEQGRPDSKKQDEKIQIGVDSFAAQFA